MRRSKVVKSDDELAIEARDAGKTQSEIRDLIAERETERAKAQAAYDTKPPSRPYLTQD